MAALTASTFQLSAQTTLPASYATPATGVDTNKPGFLVRTWQSPGEPNLITWAEEQLAGLHGANTADPAPFKDNVYGNLYYDELNTINYWDSGGEGNFPNDGVQNTPGLTTEANHDSYALEVFTVLKLPAGTIKMGVNSDDGFQVRALQSPDPREKSSLVLGQFDGGRGVADTLFDVVVTNAGYYPFRLLYEEGGGDAAVEWFTVTSDGTHHLINDSADPDAIKGYRVAVAAKAVVSTQLPAANATGVAPNAAVQVGIVEGASPITASSVKLSLDGTDTGVTATKTGNAISAKYTPAAIYAPGSKHNVVLTYTEAGSSVTNSWSFTVANYPIVPPSAKVTNADTSKPGFIWNVFANSANTATSNQKGDDAVSGLLTDADGNLLPNLADPTAVGAALAAGKAPVPDNGVVTFEIPSVINLSQTAGTSFGAFTNESQMPGIPATDGSADGFAAEILTYIDLPAGVINMGVNSDDGFRTTVNLTGSAQDAFGRLGLGEFEGGRGAADTLFYVVVQEAGIYAFRTIYEEGGGDANIEWFTFKPDGSKVLINDTNNGGLKAYRAKTGNTPPVVKSVSPSPLPRQLNQPSSALSLTIVDGTATLVDNSVALKVNGSPVNFTKTRTGNSVTLTYTPTNLFLPSEKYTAELTYQDSAGNTRTQPWTLRNVRHLVLPTPVLTENFDSYAEGSVPTGWVATNFTSTRDAGEDLDNLNSDSYKGWIVVGRTRLEGLKSRIFNLPTGLQFNGQEVTTEMMSSGNLLYAESDVRGGDQVQFIISKPFNLSTVTNPVVSFSSLYEQNQDSVGSVEYSVDGGTNWLPVVIYLDIIDTGGDVKYNPDGSVDAVTTLTAPNADTAAWVDNGVQKGDKYGDALLTPINAALGDYIAPRINDNPTVDKRIEAFSLPQASRKSDVRLRFAQLGTGSWYFGVDNIAFYDIGGSAPAAGQPKFNAVTLSGGNMTISWTGTGTLEQSDTLPGTWTAAPSQANPQTVSTTGKARFYRIKQ